VGRDSRSKGVSIRQRISFGKDASEKAADINGGLSSEQKAKGIA